MILIIATHYGLMTPYNIIYLTYCEFDPSEIQNKIQSFYQKFENVCEMHTSLFRRQYVKTKLMDNKITIMATLH